MKNEFVPYDIALAMQELGYNESIDLVLTSYYYRSSELISTTTPDSFYFEKDEMIKAPLYQQAFRWFREELGIDVCIIPKFGDNGYGAECFKNGSLLPIELLGNEYTYKEAQVACLRKLIKIVNQNKDEKKNS